MFRSTREKKGAYDHSRSYLYSPCVVKWCHYLRPSDLGGEGWMCGMQEGSTWRGGDQAEGVGRSTVSERVDSEQSPRKHAQTSAVHVSEPLLSGLFRGFRPKRAPISDPAVIPQGRTPDGMR